MESSFELAWAVILFKSMAEELKEETSEPTEEVKPSKTNPIVIVGIGAAILIVFGVIFLTGKKTVATENETEATQEVVTSQEENKEEAVLEEKVADYVVEGTEFKLTPSTLKVTAGEKVRLVFKNTGSATHDFVIDELNVATSRLSPGEEEAVEFTPTAGTYAYRCSVGNHESLGMEGNLVVE